VCTVTYNIENVGWNAYRNSLPEIEHKAENYIGRVTSEHKNSYQLYCQFGEIDASIMGRFRHHAQSKNDLPAIGDWVLFEYSSLEHNAIIKKILPRKTKFSRKKAGYKTQEQIVATNIDFVFLVAAAEDNFNLRRMERYLTLACESGAQPVIILNKIDLCPALEDRIEKMNKLTPDVPVMSMSALSGDGVSQISDFLSPGQTGALLGSSGAGKSTILNSLLGRETQKTMGVRSSDGTGRHTTSTRELFILPNGVLMIDTPGMRELQLWDSEDGLDQAFQDISQLADSCKFRDCSHTNEPGCAVEGARQVGSITEERYQSYQKLQRELNFLSHSQNALSRKNKKKKDKNLSKAIKRFYR